MEYTTIRKAPFALVIVAILFLYFGYSISSWYYNRPLPIQNKLVDINNFSILNNFELKNKVFSFTNELKVFISNWEKICRKIRDAQGEDKAKYNHVQQMELYKKELLPISVLLKDELLKRLPIKKKGYSAYKHYKFPENLLSLYTVIEDLEEMALEL